MYGIIFKITLVFTLFMSIQSSMLASEERHSRKDPLEKEAGDVFLKRSEIIPKFYELPQGSSFSEITQDLLSHPVITDLQKKRILENGRRLYVFSYPSDGLKIIGIISIVPHAEKPSTIILLRGGNRLFGLPHPASDLFNTGTDTIISTTYRDGVSEGRDEFGGDDVNDVKHLIDYIPKIEKQLGRPISQRQLYLIGESRGGMQMFLTLARYPKLQDKCAKIVSLSGILDVRATINERQDMRSMFIEDFGLTPKNEEEWIKYRNPLNTIKHLRKNLPILIIQGTNDIRVSLVQGHRMVKGLQDNGNDVTYWEIEGNHGLTNRSDQMEVILNWLKNSSLEIR